jgi:hypothetical protein
MEDLSLHILDIAENSIRAEAKLIRIEIAENGSSDLLKVTITDDGSGMTEEQKTRALDPFYTTKTTRRFGLGLSLLAEAARAAGGGLALESSPGQGTEVKISFRLSHIDRQPTGDMAKTMVTLITGHPEIDFLYSHKVNGKRFTLDTREIKEKLDEVPIQSPEIMNFIRNYILEGLDNIKTRRQR